MSKVNLYNIFGEKIGQEELNDKVFGLEIKEALIHQAVEAQLANRRSVIAHTKDRSEVRGGGRKPWRQKGTGRARHGSIRSPLWRGGGITFGPTKERNFQKKINKKMKRQAILMCLSDRVRNNKLILLDQLVLNEIKTKKIKEILSKFPSQGKKTLIVLPKADKNIIKSAANLDKTGTIKADCLNVLDLLKFEYLILSKESVEIISKVYGVF